MPDSPNRTLSALINMLDDPDDKIYSLISTEIVAFGTAAIPPLKEALNNCLNKELEERIIEVLSKLRQSNLVLDFKEWVENDTDDLLRGFMLVTMTRYSDLDAVEMAAIIAHLKTDIWIELHEGLTAMENIKVMYHILFRVHQFEGIKDEISAPENSYLNTLLQTKKGSSLTLGMLYLILARQLELPIYGVNLPQHFILAYLREPGITNPDEGDVLFYIDPFNLGTVFTRREIDQFIGQMKIKPEKSFYEPCSNPDIIRRLINNLIFSYKSRGLDEKADELNNLLDLM